MKLLKGKTNLYFMDNYFDKLCNENYACQLGCYFSSMYNADEYTLVTSKYINSLLWNHIFINNEICEEKMNELISKYRLPVYIYESETKSKLLLENRGFELKDIESWMWIRPSSFKLNDKFKYKIVNKNEEKKLFCDVLEKCFGRGYAEALIKEKIDSRIKQVFHINIYFENLFVGIGSLYVLKNVSFIHNVAVKENYRKRGFSTEISKYLINLSYIVNKKNNLFLQCNGGKNGHEHVYEKTGFKLLFRRYGYIKGSDSIGL